MTLVERVLNQLATLGETVTVRDADRRKPRPAFTPPPEPWGPLLRDVLADIQHLEEALLDMTTERDMYRERCKELEQEAAA